MLIFQQFGTLLEWPHVNELMIPTQLIQCRFVLYSSEWIRPKTATERHIFSTTTLIRPELELGFSSFFSSLSHPEAKPKLAINCVRLCTQEHIERSIYTLLLSVDYQRVTATCWAFVKFFTHFSISFFSVCCFPFVIFQNLLSIAMEAEALSHWMAKQVFISFFTTSELRFWIRFVVKFAIIIFGYIIWIVLGLTAVFY